MDIIVFGVIFKTLFKILQENLEITKILVFIVIYTQYNKLVIDVICIYILYIVFE